MPLIGERNVLLHATRQSNLPPEESIQKKRLLKDKQLEIQEKTKIALGEWYEHQASLVVNIDMDPWTAWKASKLVCKGKFAHYKDVLNKTSRFCNKEGNLAQNDAENADIVIPHLEKYTIPSAQSTSNTLRNI